MANVDETSITETVEYLTLEVLIDIRDQLARFYETGITTMSVS